MGDVGFIDKHGWVWVIGRESGRIKTGGKNVYPDEDKSLSGVINFEAASEDEIKQVVMLAKIAVNFIDKHGWVWVIGRESGRIKTGGKNVYPEEKTLTRAPRSRGGRATIAQRSYGGHGVTIKSDVYSFGVIFVELLTKRKPASSVADKSGDSINIIPYFISYVKDNSLSGVINFGAASEDEIKQVEMLAKIAVKCLDQNNRKRPRMSEVAQQLPPIHQSSTVAVEPNFEVAETICPTVEFPVTHCLSCLGLDQGCCYI
ncbi:uncharacterized protein LOC120293926 [Eucalyptus grandis]|uniref:uncharacterized protein LOC120293926 n=1 Tax=Eucalyptus grandis TaxID=71139 RepID=UPI00192EB29E|nr:uncharacterized protein LOC120293926 [Eucalyptus grandis]